MVAWRCLEESARLGSLPGVWLARGHVGWNVSPSMCPCVHKRVLGGLPGARSQMTPGLLGSQLRPLWGHSHLKPHGG